MSPTLPANAFIKVTTKLTAASTNFPALLANPFAKAITILTARSISLGKLCSIT